MNKNTNIDVHVFVTRDNCFAAIFSWTENGKQRRWITDKDNKSIESLIVDIYSGLSSLFPEGLVDGSMSRLVFITGASDLVPKESMN